MKIYVWLHKMWHLITYRFRKSKIHVNRALISGDGSFIDVRYWLSRPDKVQGRFPVYLLDEASGQRFELMRLAKYGAIKTKHSIYQSAGILLFRNRNCKIRPGDKVTLIYGPLQAKHIEVR